MCLREMWSPLGVAGFIFCVSQVLVKSVPDTSFGLTYIDGRVLITQVTDNFVHDILCVTASGQSRFTAVTPSGSGRAWWGFEGRTGPNLTKMGTSPRPHHVPTLRPHGPCDRRVGCPPARLRRRCDRPWGDGRTRAERPDRPLLPPPPPPYRARVFHNTGRTSFVHLGVSCPGVCV